MAVKRNVYSDWRVWLVVLLIIIVILWLLYGNQVEDFEGIDFLINNTKKKKPEQKDKKDEEVKTKPKRMTSKGEEHCRQILEKIFNVPFKPTRNLVWLKNPETKRHLELDCYNADLGIALEYSGRQHYQYTPAFQKSINDFIQQIRRDDLKRRLCIDNNVWLIVVPFSVPESKREEWISKRLPQQVGLSTNYSNIF